MFKCTVCRQESRTIVKEAEYVFQGESLCDEHFEAYLSSMIFLTKGQRPHEEEN